MKAINNWDKVQAIGDFPKLPKGGYAVEIKDARVRTGTRRDGGTYEQLEIALDIIEGEYKGHYQMDFKAQRREDKKWRGVLRLFVPSGDGSDQDNLTAGILKASIEAVEDSNPGYHWDWDEKKLKGKKTGCIFRMEEWAKDGRSGWKAQPFKFIDIEKIRSGEFKVPDDKPLKVDAKRNAAPKSNLDVDFEDLEDESDLPF